MSVWQFPDDSLADGHDTVYLLTTTLVVINFFPANRLFFSNEPIEFWNRNAMSKDRGYVGGG